MHSALWWVNDADAPYPTHIVALDDYSNTMNIPFVDLAEQQRRIRMDLDRRIARMLIMAPTSLVRKWANLKPPSRLGRAAAIALPSPAEQTPFWPC